jgi:hypothetical protein
LGAPIATRSPRPCRHPTWPGPPRPPRGGSRDTCSALLVQDPPARRLRANARRSGAGSRRRSRRAVTTPNCPTRTTARRRTRPHRRSFTLSCELLENGTQNRAQQITTAQPRGVRRQSSAAFH